MFKLAVFSDEVGQDLDVIVKFCKDFGLDGVELRSLWGRKTPNELNDEELWKIKTQLGAEGLRVCSIASPFFKCVVEELKEVQHHLTILDRCLDMAEFLGAAVVRGFTGWRKEEADDTLARVAGLFQLEVVPVLEGRKAVLAIENESSTYVGSGKELADFLDLVGSDRVAACWDPGNCVSMDETPFPDGYALVKDRIAHVHVKDIARTDDGAAPAPVGEGVVDFAGQFKALAKDGYQGWLSLETHWRKAEKLSEDAVQRPGGEEFSAGAEEASRICMENMKRILSEAGVQG